MPRFPLTPHDASTTKTVLIRASLEGLTLQCFLRAQQDAAFYETLVGHKQDAARLRRATAHFARALRALGHDPASVELEA